MARSPNDVSRKDCIRVAAAEEKVDARLVVAAVMPM